MNLADDPQNCQVDTAVIAERGAMLCKESEIAFEKLQAVNPRAVRPVYIVGSEVPIPGGSQETEEGLHITIALDFENTVAAFKKAFQLHGLANAWNNVIGGSCAARCRIWR
jgi:D-tagatose-1,6-bisphosphate aldolase subunit GatZ/KbaZ